MEKRAIRNYAYIDIRNDGFMTRMEFRQQKNIAWLEDIRKEATRRFTEDAKRERAKEQADGRD